MYAKGFIPILKELLHRTSKVREAMGRKYEDNLLVEARNQPYQNPDWTRIEGAVAIEEEIRKMIKELDDGAST